MDKDDDKALPAFLDRMVWTEEDIPWLKIDNSQADGEPYNFDTTEDGDEAPPIGRDDVKR